MNFLRHTKALLLRVVRSLGCDVSRTTALGNNPFVDIRKLATAVPRLGFVGANKVRLPVSCDASSRSKNLLFRTVRRAFRTLQQELGADSKISLERIAFGDHKGEATLYENAENVTNSLLPNAPEAHVSQPASYAIPAGQYGDNTERAIRRFARPQPRPRGLHVKMQGCLGVCWPRAIDHVSDWPASFREVMSAGGKDSLISG